MDLPSSKTPASLPAEPLDRAYALDVLRQAWGGPAAVNEAAASLWEPLARHIWPHLTAQRDEDGDRSYRGLRSAPDFHEAFAALERRVPAAGEAPRVSLARWPDAAPFALMLSHDIDQIYDRELFRVIADVNHIRRILTQGETGHAGLASRRVLRALFRPKRTLWDFETILSLEARHGFRSTFFVLHDRYFARQGARFNVEDRALREIARMVRAVGSELGVHGGYYRFNDAAQYRESRLKLSELFGVETVGIRNHLLRFSYPGTWQAQAAAGFAYDATYGYRSVPGPRGGLAFPFWIYDPAARGPSTMLELPLTVMDTSIFRYLRLEGERALEYCWQMVERLAGYGALVTLLWHNNFFNEPEYWDWHMVYERLLERLASLKPWCVPGAEINRWWRARAAVQFETRTAADGAAVVTLRAGSEIKGLVLEVAGGEWTPSVPGAPISPRRTASGWQAALPPMPAGGTLTVNLVRI